MGLTFAVADAVGDMNLGTLALPLPRLALPGVPRVGRDGVLSLFVLEAGVLSVVLLYTPVGVDSGLSGAEFGGRGVVNAEEALSASSRVEVGVGYVLLEGDLLYTPLLSLLFPLLILLRVCVRLVLRVLGGDSMAGVFSLAAHEAVGAQMLQRSRRRGASSPGMTEAFTLIRRLHDLHLPMSIVSGSATS